MPAGRPPGSPNVRSEKRFSDALRAALAADDCKALRRIAGRLIGMAEDGDLQAIGMIADRLEGKPKQATDITLGHAVARELTDAELLAIVAGAEQEGVTIASDETPEPAKIS
jgi:HPt (histidine-containing phosphotransfer) domain-containing protein